MYTHSARERQIAESSWFRERAGRSLAGHDALATVPGNDTLPQSTQHPTSMVDARGRCKSVGAHRSTSAPELTNAAEPTSGKVRAVGHVVSCPSLGFCEALDDMPLSREAPTEDVPLMPAVGRVSHSSVIFDEWVEHFRFAETTDDQLSADELYGDTLLGLDAGVGTCTSGASQPHIGQSLWCDERVMPRHIWHQTHAVVCHEARRPTSAPQPNLLEFEVAGLVTDASLPEPSRASLPELPSSVCAQVLGGFLLCPLLAKPAGSALDDMPLCREALTRDDLAIPLTLAGSQGSSSNVEEWNDAIRAEHGEEQASKGDETQGDAFCRLIFVPELESSSSSSWGTQPAVAGEEFTVVLSKVGASSTLGLEVQESATKFEVQEIRPDGLIAEHNATHPWNQVRATDGLKSVNGLSGSAVLMLLRGWHEGETLTCVFVRGTSWTNVQEID